VLFYYYTGGIVLNFLSQYTFFGSKKYDRLHFLEPKRVFMKRHIIKELCQWQKSTRRKPLIVMGARQVGKTTSLKHFAATYYKNSVYLNFEDEPHLLDFGQKSVK
jgi:predicted AAA+ superfamily ATPase